MPLTHVNKAILSVYIQVYNAQPHAMKISSTYMYIGGTFTEYVFILICVNFLYNAI